MRGRIADPNQRSQTGDGTQPEIGRGGESREPTRDGSARGEATPNAGHEHLCIAFGRFVLSGEVDELTLSAVYSILDASGEPSPAETMRSWVWQAKERFMREFELGAEQTEFLSVEISSAYPTMELGESFFVLYRKATESGEPSQVARIRLAMVSMLGERDQVCLVEEFNERLRSR